MTPSNTCLLGPTLVYNGFSIGSAVFTQLTADCPYTSQWAAPFPLKISPSHGEYGPRAMRGSFGNNQVFLPHPSPQPKRHLDRFSRFCRAHDHNRPTDRPYATPSVTHDRIYVRSTAMRPKKLANRTKLTKTKKCVRSLDCCDVIYTVFQFQKVTPK